MEPPSPLSVLAAGSVIDGNVTAASTALAAESKPTSRSRHVYLVAAIVLVGVVTRACQLADRSFWFDEAFSWRLIEMPFFEMIERAGRDNHTPLYFVLLRGWAALFGSGVVALRSLSVLFGAVTIIGTYLFVAEAYRPKGGTRRDDVLDQARRARSVALFAAALVALSVFQIRWSWEVRMYTMGTALAVFSSWAMFHALNAVSPSWQRWLLYGLLASLFIYSHYYALFSVAVQGVFIFGWYLVSSQGRLAVLIRSLSYPAAALGVLVVACLPWLPVFLAQRAQVQTGFWTTPVTGWDIANVCYQMLVEPENAVYSFALPLIVTIVCSASMLALLWRAQAPDWYLFIATVGPFVLSVAVSATDTKIFHLRYFLFSNLFFLASVAALVTRIPYPTERRLLSGWILVTCLIINYSFREKLDMARKPGARACAAFLAEKRNANEPVVVCSPLLYFTMLYHAHDRSGWLVYNDGRGVVHYEGGAIITSSDLIYQGGLDAIESETLWVVDMTGWGNREVPVPGTWSRTHETRYPEVYHVQGEIILRQYTRTRPRK